ncbi:MAG: hypothetical protein Q8K00_15185 [Syntrophales bacterium]|nr:hypothetical protein [Syntrophales bacterium]
MDESIGGVFLYVKGHFAGTFCIRKAGLAMRLGMDGGTSAALFEKSAHHLVVESPFKKAFLSTLQADLSFTP